MAARPLDKKITDGVIADWRVGQLSQNDIADKYKVSKGMVNKLCKGIERDLASTVTAGVQYKQALAQQDDRTVTAVTEAVNEKLRRLEFFDKAQLLAAQTVVRKLQRDGSNASFLELSQASSALSKNREGVIGKNPDTVINNTNSQQVANVTVMRTPEQIRAIREMMDAAL